MPQTKTRNLSKGWANLWERRDVINCYVRNITAKRQLTWEKLACIVPIRATSKPRIACLPFSVSCTASGISWLLYTCIWSLSPPRLELTSASWVKDATVASGEGKRFSTTTSFETLKRDRSIMADLENDFGVGARHGNSHSTLMGTDFNNSNYHSYYSHYCYCYYLFFLWGGGGRDQWLGAPPCIRHWDKTAPNTSMGEIQLLL